MSFVFCLLSFFLHQDHHCGSLSSSPRIVSGAEAGLHDALPVTKHVKLRQRHVWRHLNTSQVLSFCFFFFTFSRQIAATTCRETSQHLPTLDQFYPLLSFFQITHFPLKKTQFEIHRFRQVTVENIVFLCL